MKKPLINWKHVERDIKKICIEKNKRFVTSKHIAETIQENETIYCKDLQNKPFTTLHRLVGKALINLYPRFSKNCNGGGVYVVTDVNP